VFKRGKLKRITAIRKGTGKSVNVFLDGSLAFRLEEETARREGLQTGEELADERIEAFSRADGARRCLSAALRFISYRPRAEAELRGRLKQRGFDTASVEGVILKLKEQGLVDDTAFARFWQDNRASFSPRSRALTSLELRRKGVAGDVIALAVSGVGDEESAYRAAQSKARLLARSGYDVFRRRLGDYLRRRGFGFGVIARTVERLWRETSEEVNNKGKLK
jgi:regulatory protein